MRAIATSLGVEAMSLYNHVKNKDEILDGMVDLVIEEIALPADIDDWRDAMRRRAVSAYEVFSRHPWAPALVDSRETSGPARLRYFDWVLGTLVRTGFPLQTAVRCFSVLDSYIYGFGKQEMSISAEGVPPEVAAEAILAFIPAEQYPYLHDVAVLAMESGYDAEADFGFGLEIILDGLEEMLSDGSTSPRKR
jgi:AcrR family transcriptional regulator